MDDRRVDVGRRRALLPAAVAAVAVLKGGSLNDGDMEDYISPPLPRTWTTWLE